MKFDVAIIGSGFSGALLAWILSKAGRKVALLDRGRHPRFAIGESSTPLADFLLEELAEEFHLPELKPLSRWGSWQRDYPNLACGKKRGFSYFSHDKNKQFTESASHSQSLLVAASASDEVSDTHWFRADVDAWICKMAKSQGSTLHELAAVDSVRPSDMGWHVRWHGNETWGELECEQIVDTTGPAGIVPRALQCPDWSGKLRVQTGSLFGHFSNVKSMTPWLENQGFETGDSPFDADDAAQHHLFQSGWMWMLRFNHGVTSVGIVQNIDEWTQHEALDDPASREQAWKQLVSAYPTIEELLSDAQLINPTIDGSPALGWIPRMSRLWGSAAGNAWALLPSTVGLVDPLHSTGIAHSLSGIQRLARILTASPDISARLRHDYSSDIVEEIRWIDQIVWCCYQAQRDSFELFAAVCSLYFVAAIHSERAMSTHEEIQAGFLMHKSQNLRETVSWTEGRLKEHLARGLGTQSRTRLIDSLRQRLKPWNDVGLLAPELQNRIARSTADK